MDSTDVAVVDRGTVGPDTFTLTFDTPAGFEGRAGQFVRLSAAVDGESYARFYTLSSPDTEDTFEVTAEVHEEGGPFSAYLADLTVGEEITMAGPFGEDYYEDESRAVVLAGGPGIGAAIAIAEAAVANDAEAAVVYSYDGEPAHTERLDALEAAGAEVVRLGEDAGADAFHTAVDDVLTGAEDEGVFVYGFTDFVDLATEAIEGAGGDVDGAKVENFG
jgi:ferredoxin-NADP reductase